MRKDFERIVLVTGIMKDKNIEKMCSLFNEVVDEVIITRPKIERASVPDGISIFITKPNIIIEDVLTAVEFALDNQKRSISKTLVVLAGSIFTVGEALERMKIKL
jgi:dihydrofolate synthase/folylpolyglutamate synthase